MSATMSWPDHASRVPDHQHPRRHVARDHAPGPDQRPGPDPNAAHDRGVGAIARPRLDNGRDDLPVAGPASAKQVAFGVDGGRVAIVGEADVWPDEGAILDGHAARDERERFHLYGPAKRHATLDLHKRRDLALIANRAAVQVDQVGMENDDIAPERDVRSDRHRLTSRAVFTRMVTWTAHSLPDQPVTTARQPVCPAITEPGRSDGTTSASLPGKHASVQGRLSMADQQRSSGELAAVSPAQARGGRQTPVDGIVEDTSRVNPDSGSATAPVPDIDAQGGSEQGGMAGPVGYFEGEGNEGP